MKWGLVLSLWFLSFNVLGQDVLPIYAFEIIPLIYQDSNKEIKGSWYKSFEELSKLTNIKFEYHFVSIPRMEMLLAGSHSGCNLTLLKTKSRIDKGIQFIHEHHEKTIFKIYQRSDDPQKWTVEEIQKRKNKVITNTSVAIEILKEKAVDSELIFNINTIVHMLLMKRVDYIVGSNLAIEEMPEFKQKKIMVGGPVKTLSHGIGCSPSTPKNLVKRIQKAAKKWRLPNAA